jgi:predicted nucleotidyltransferase
VAARTFLDSRTEAFVADVLTCIDSHVPVIEAFLLGSGAVGGFQPGVSDVDLVVVVEHALGTERAALVERLAALEPPVRDLELVVYVEGSQPPSFELNLNKGAERPNEEPFWFVLDAAIAQEHAVPLWGRRGWTEVFAPIPLERIRGAMEESLDWATRQALDDEFARLHAERARHYLAHGTWITKKEAKE